MVVNEGSLAEQYGMLKGDVIVRINEAPTSNLTHFEAHELLVHAGNSFVLGVLRDKEVTPAGPPPKAPSVCSEKSAESRPVSRNESRTSNHEVPQTVATPPAITEQQQAQLTEIDKIVKDGPITDEEIAELISGEAEVLKNLNVIGVNFNRMMPKTMSLKTSAVFQTLNQEAMKTRQDLEDETKKWTTFLQKPDRPVTKPKEVHDPNRPAPYQVKIVKQPKPRVAPDRVATPPPREPEPAALKDDLQKELQQQLKDKPKQRPKSKQSFGGLTPQERPIFLPGGRKWRNPRDAYNEDFIAEVISSQAEIIKGTTLGINFLKYQKPEKDVSFIKNSETYKMIHHLDKEPESGIEARPEKVVAEEDLRRILNANFHLHHENQLDN